MAEERAGGPARPVGIAGMQAVRTKNYPSGDGELARLVDVRTGGHDGFDRVVLEFTGPDVPSHRVSLVRPPIRMDGTGDEVEVAGTAFLELRLSPAGGLDLSGAAPRETYTGPVRVPGSGTRVVTELVRTSDVEATLAWVVGLSRPLPFAVKFLNAPARLVVDLPYS